MESVTPQLRSIVGVARALIQTVGVDEAVAILIAQFGWDVALTAFSHIEGEEGGHAMWVVLEHDVFG